MTIPEFEADMRRQLLVTRMRQVAVQGVVVTPQEIEQEYRRKNEKVKVEYVKISRRTSTRPKCSRAWRICSSISRSTRPGTPCRTGVT